MRRLVFGLAAVAACAVVAESGAQPAPPGLPSLRITTVSPAGAKAGTTLDVTVAGFDLDDPTRLVFSHPGITGEFLPSDEKPPAPDPAKKGKMAGGKKRGPGDPRQFRVTVGPAVPPGTYDLRVAGRWGVSNPRAFVVGTLPEVSEAEPNDDVPQAQTVALGTTVNGTLTSPTDVDYTAFAGKKGQRVVLSCLTSSIDSRAKPAVEVFDSAGRKLAHNHGYRDADALADVVLPHDGEFTVRVAQFTYQTGGPDHGYRLTIGTAPWVDAVVPPAIDPGKPAQVTLYGRNLPGGKPSGFSIDGRPLDQATVTVTPPADPLAAQRLTLRDHVAPLASLQDAFEYRVTGPGGVSNAVPIHFAREKTVAKKNTGGTRPETAEPIPTPCAVVGMLHRRGDRDWYRFDAKKGDVLMVELTGEQTGSPADFFFTVSRPADAKGTAGPQDLSGEIDDDADRQSGGSLHPSEFYTRTGDPPEYKFTAPADGPFLVAVGCREAGYLYGPRTAYRLRVGPPRPDFRAIVKPYARGLATGSAARPGGTEAFDVFINRMDGFTGAVTVTAEGLPPGVTATPTVIGPAARWGVLVLKVAPSAAAFTGAITVKATATGADGKPLVREARPAAVTWSSPQPGQNNLPVVSRLTQSLVLAVRPEPGFFTLAVDTANVVVKPAGGKEKEAKASGPLVVKQGDKLTLPVKVTWAGPDKQPVTLAVDPMMPNLQSAPITVQPGTQPTKDKPEGTLNLDVKTTAFPGTYSLAVRGDAAVPFTKDATGKGAKTNVPTSAFAAPVVITVLPTSLAKVTAGPLPGGAVKLGKSALLVVKVERQYDFAGEYTVKYVPPAGVTGVTATAVTIPAGQTEAKLTIAAAADAKPGAVSGGLVVVTAQYAGKHPVTHETKVNFTVAK